MSKKYVLKISKIKFEKKWLHHRLGWSILKIAAYSASHKAIKCKEPKLYMLVCLASKIAKDWIPLIAI